MMASRLDESIHTANTTTKDLDLPPLISPSGHYMYTTNTVPTTRTMRGTGGGGGERDYDDPTDFSVASLQRPGGEGSEIGDMGEESIEKLLFESTSTDLNFTYDKGRLMLTGEEGGGGGGEGLDQQSSILYPPSSQSQTSSILLNESKADDYSTLDTVQYQGKKCLFAKYLRHLVTLYNTIAAPSTLKADILDFSRSALTDDDIIQVIDWLRLMSIKDIRCIDFKSNLMTSKSVIHITNWLLSLPRQDLLERSDPLHINFQHNMVRCSI
jgi:hypothetical protein